MILSYLDTCGYGRLVDSLLHTKVAQERAAVWDILGYVRHRKIQLAWSFVLDEEIYAITDPDKRIELAAWKQQATIFVTPSDAIDNLAQTIMSTGVKKLDALHVAAAIHAHCQLFITTDKRLQRYANPKIYLCDPIEALEIIQKLHDTL
jgi:predicted nucleic acid-binding protein